MATGFSKPASHPGQLNWSNEELRHDKAKALETLQEFRYAAHCHWEFLDDVTKFMVDSQGQTDPVGSLIERFKTPLAKASTNRKLNNNVLNTAQRKLFQDRLQHGEFGSAGARGFDFGRKPIEARTIVAEKARIIKEREELARERQRLEEEAQKQVELRLEQERELQRQREAEETRARELEKQRAAEVARELELAREREAEAARERERMLEIERRELEQERQRLQAEEKRQEELKIARERELEQQREAEAARERELAKQKEAEAELERQRLLELEREKEKELEAERQRLLELEREKEKELEAERQRLLELEREKEKELEAERQRRVQEELQRQQEREIEQKRQASAERKMKALEEETRRQQELLQAARQEQQRRIEKAIEKDRQARVPSKEDKPQKVPRPRDQPEKAKPAPKTQQRIAAPPKEIPSAHKPSVQRPQTSAKILMPSQERQQHRARVEPTPKQPTASVARPSLKHSSSQEALPPNAKRARLSKEPEPPASQPPPSRIKGPPIRPSAGNKKPGSIWNGDQSVLQASSIPTKPVNGKIAHPMDMAKISKATIPFAVNPNPAGPIFKTPARNDTQSSTVFVAKPAMHRLQSPVAPPQADQFPNGDAIELPEIFTDDEDEEDDEEEDEDDDGVAGEHKGKSEDLLPTWARAANLTEQLLRQETINPMHIFGQPQPIDLEKVFDKSTERFPSFRKRTSSANWDSGDQLTVEEIRKDLAARKKMRKDGGWSMDLAHQLS